MSLEIRPSTTVFTEHPSQGVGHVERMEKCRWVPVEPITCVRVTGSMSRFDTGTKLTSEREEEIEPAGERPSETTLSLVHSLIPSNMNSTIKSFSCIREVRSCTSATKKPEQSSRDNPIRVENDKGTGCTCVVTRSSSDRGVNDWVSLEME